MNIHVHASGSQRSESPFNQFLKCMFFIDLNTQRPATFSKRIYELYRYFVCIYIELCSRPLAQSGSMLPVQVLLVKWPCDYSFIDHILSSWGINDNLRNCPQHNRQTSTVISWGVLIQFTHFIFVSYTKYIESCKFGNCKNARTCTCIFRISLYSVPSDSKHICILQSCKQLRKKNIMIWIYMYGRQIPFNKFGINLYGTENIYFTDRLTRTIGF